MTAIDEEAEASVEVVVLLVLSELVGLDPVLVLATWFHDLSSRDVFVFMVAAVLPEVELLEVAPEVELLGVELLLEFESLLEGSLPEVEPLEVELMLELELGAELLGVEPPEADGPLFVIITPSKSMLSLPAPSLSKDITTLGTLLDNLRTRPSANLRPFSFSRSIVVLHSRLTVDPLVAQVLDSHQGVALSSSEVLPFANIAKSSLLKRRTLAHVLLSALFGSAPPEEVEEEALSKLLFCMVDTRELVPVFTIDVTSVVTFRVVAFI